MTCTTSDPRTLITSSSWSWASSSSSCSAVSPLWRQARSGKESHDWLFLLIFLDERYSLVRESIRTITELWERFRMLLVKNLIESNAFLNKRSLRLLFCLIVVKKRVVFSMKKEKKRLLSFLARDWNISRLWESLMLIFASFDWHIGLPGTLSRAESGFSAPCSEGWSRIE